MSWTSSVSRRGFMVLFCVFAAFQSTSVLDIDLWSRGKLSIMLVFKMRCGVASRTAAVAGEQSLTCIGTFRGRDRRLSVVSMQSSLELRAFARPTLLRSATAKLAVGNVEI